MEIERLKYYLIKIIRLLLIGLLFLIFFALSLLAFTTISGGGPPHIGPVLNLLIAAMVPALIFITPLLIILFYKLLSPSQKKWTIVIGVFGIILTSIFALPFLSIPFSQMQTERQFSEVFGAEWNQFDVDIDDSFYQTPFNLIYSYLDSSPVEETTWNLEEGVIFKNTSDYTLKTDIYYPGPEANTNIGKYATLIYLHGGGWAVGDRKMAKERHQYFAAQGYVVFSIDYRLCKIETATMVRRESGMSIPVIEQIDVAPDDDYVGEYSIKDMMVDIGNFTQFLARNEGKAILHGADLDYVFVYGQSAGSHLAGLMGFGFNNELNNPHWGFSKNLTVRGTVLFYPPNDARRLFYEDHRFYYDAGLTEGKTPSEDPDFYDRYTPSQHIDDNDPPCLIFHGTSDSMVPTENSYEIQEECKENQINCILAKMPFVGHAFDFSSSLKVMSSYYMERWLYLTNIN